MRFRAGGLGIRPPHGGLKGKGIQGTGISPPTETHFAGPFPLPAIPLPPLGELALSALQGVWLARS